MSNPNPNPSSSTTKQELPWAFIDCPTDILIILLTHMLNLLIEHNDQVVLTPDALTRFHSRAPPGISVLEYLRRIVKYSNLEKIPLLSLLHYIDITCLNLPTFTLSSLTVHRFLIAGVCAGSKAQCDVFCTNAHYAKVGGIKVHELNALERELVKVTGWNLCCHADQLQRYYTSLIRSHAGYTQAPPPEISPFRQFPRSLSKPRSNDETDIGPSPSPAPTGEEEGDEDMSDSYEGDSAEEAEGKGMVVDPGPSRGRGRGRDRSVPTAMEVDSSMKAGLSQSSNVTNESPISSGGASASSASSRSASGRRVKRGRRLSTPLSNARVAEPKMDTTPVTIQQRHEVDHEVNIKSSADTDHNGHSSTSSTSNNNGSNNSANDPQSHGHGHGKFIKSLGGLGGIFHRRKSTDHQNTQHTIIPSKPIGIPTPTLQISNTGTSRNGVKEGDKPGLAKPVTPKVRTRDETSLDVPRERLVLDTSTPS